ncbi:RNB-domain-containing protein [Gigaspora margarita]|uniref:DIS3-like exonuclease 2 n=1 Tax=Gigaspora margarita TaxID=4874 RepID=A0A8H3WUF4_GIGMA|nr:RNB-domain-containing protein [Gigaspora margarita]
MSSETNTTEGSSSLTNETLSVTTSNENTTLVQEDSAEKQARKKQNRQNWKGSSKGDGKEVKANKPIVTSDDNSNDNADEKKKKEKKGNKNRTPSTDGSDQSKNKEAEVLDINVTQHQRRKSTANTSDISNKNKNSNNNSTDKSVHRRGKSMANVGELQGVSSKNGNGKSKGSKDDSENKSEALESLQQIIASLKSLPAVPSKSQKSEKRKDGDDSSADFTSKHKLHESNASGTGKRTNAPSKQHKKGTSVSFSFPLTTAVTTSLKSIPDSEDGKPIDIENALQDTISSLRRMSLDKGKVQKEKETDKKKDDGEDDETEEEKKTRRKKNSMNRKSPNPDDMAQSSIDKKQELDSPKSPFDFKKPTDDQRQLTAKKTHRRHQSLGYTLSTSSSSTSIVNPNIPMHGRRHSVALNGSKDVLKELEKNQGRLAVPEVKGHRRSNSRNFEGNWRSTASPLSALAQPFQPFPIPKFGAIQKKQQQNQQNSNNQQQRKSLFAPYLPQASLPPLLKSCQLVSGVLRINKRNRSDAYVSTESLDADIYICGSKDRNRALEGDVVAVELLDPDKVWQTKKEKEEKKRKKEESAGIDKKKIDKKKDDVEVEGQGLLLFEDDDIVTDEQRPKYCGHVVAVMERMPGQLFSGTLALLRPSSTATKEREAAEKARREAEDRAAGIEPKVEEPREEKKDNKNERPKIVWFKPTDKRVPLIAIPTEQAPNDFVENHQSYAQQLFVACIKRWPITSLHPFGTLVTQIGEIGNIEVETEALLKDNNVSSEEFNENVIKCLPSIPWTIPEKEFETRRDLRTIARIFSIDPPTSKDLDDAVSCSRLPDGNYEIGVHIADVSYFVKQNSALDREARKRATTVYLVQKSVPMLPQLISEELCSLNPGKDRLAFSVIWKMTPEGKHTETWYGRTIIRPCAKLSYGNAQEVIEGKPLNPEVKIFNDYNAKEIEADIRVFHGLSQRLREQRLKRGALSLGSIKLNFELDEHNSPIECHVYDHKEANQLVEEFMLLANMSVAQKISSAFPEQALLRRHASPIERRLNDFVEHVKRLGYDFEASSAGALQRSFNAVDDDGVKQVLKLLAIKPMQRAKYFCTGTLDIAKYHHYALNVPLYTHFTSPIRRYADVLVHRMLEAALSGEKRFYLDKDAVQKTANHCNVKKEAAKNAQEQSSHLFLCVLLHNLTVQSGPVIREAVVIGVKDHAFDVLVPVFGIEKRVHLDQLPLEKFIFNNETGELALHWKQGVSSLEPIPEDDGFGEDEEDGLDVDEEALLADVNDDYHYELMDVTSLPIEDEHRLFDANSDIGDDDIEDDEFQESGDEEGGSNDDTSIVAVPSMSSSESPKMDIPSTETASLNQTASTKSSLPLVKATELPQLPIVSDPAIPNSQIIEELCRLQVVITADCKKSPPVIKVLAVNPYA